MCCNNLCADVKVLLVMRTGCHSPRFFYLAHLPFTELIVVTVRSFTMGLVNVAFNKGFIHSVKQFLVYNLLFTT